MCVYCGLTSLQPDVRCRHILEPDICRWSRMHGLTYSCLAVDTQFSATMSEDGKASEVKVDTGVIVKGPFERFLFHVQGPAPAAAQDSLTVQHTDSNSASRREACGGRLLHRQQPSRY